MLHITPVWQRSRRHKVVVVSDLHFPRGDSHPKYLYEFLYNNPSDTLIVLGDFFEGYAKTIENFGEWHKRCLDLIHQRVNEENLKYIIIPGNHDQYLRHGDVLDHELHDALYRRHLVLDGHGGQKTYLTHGDDYDPYALKDNEMMAFQAGERIRVARVSLSEIFNYYIGSSDKRLKASFEKRSSAPVEKKIRKGIVASATEHECNAVLCGHTHEPQPFTPVKRHTWLRYGNAGSFTGKLATAMVLTHGDRWTMINWMRAREEHGLDALPHRDHVNPAAAYREQTEAVLDFHRTLHAVWITRRMMAQTLQTLESLRGMAARLDDMMAMNEEKLTHILKRIARRPARVDAARFLSTGAVNYEPVPVLVA